MPVEAISYYTNILSFAVIGVCWFVFAATLLYDRGSSSSGSSGREPLSWFGLVLQLLSYPMIWAIWRSPLFSPFIDELYGVNIVCQVIAATMGIWSTWLARSAITELGRQWSLQARVLEDHDLVTTGVYGLVRHPIYTAMLGMLIANGIVLSHWLALGVGVVVFMAGTRIRVHLEEKLLAMAFGERFFRWRSSVPSLIPYPKRAAPD